MVSRRARAYVFLLFAFTGFFTPGPAIVGLLEMHAVITGDYRLVRKLRGPADLNQERPSLQPPLLGHACTMDVDPVPIVAPVLVASVVPPALVDWPASPTSTELYPDEPPWPAPHALGPAATRPRGPPSA